MDETDMPIIIDPSKARVMIWWINAAIKLFFVSKMYL